MLMRGASVREGCYMLMRQSGIMLNMLTSKMASAGPGLCSTVCRTRWQLICVVAFLLPGLLAKEYCVTDQFRAKCQDDQIIVIQRALYGRMHRGRCIQDELGHMGCQQDVISLVDNVCSGKPKCEIANIAVTFKDITPCPKGLWCYLEIDYKCLSVFLAGPSQCTSSGAVYAPPAPGYLGNSVPGHSPCTAQHNSWIIEVSSTQRVNLTLHDFATLDNKDLASCKMYATVREEGQDEEVPVCGSVTRWRQVYISHGNRVEVSLAAPDGIQGARFLLQYEASGCSEPKYPSDMWMKVSKEGITLGCYTSKTTWRLVCEGGVWQGILGNCSQDIEQKYATTNITRLTMPGQSEGALTFLVAAVAVVITIAILVVALLYTNRGSAPAIALGSLDEPYEAKDITFFRDDPRATCQNDTAASTMHHTHTNGLPRESCVSVPVSNSDSDTYASENATLPLRAHDMEGFDSTLQPPLPSKNRQTPKPPTPDIPPPELPPKCPPKVGSGYRRNDLGPYTKLNSDNAFPNRENQLTYKSLQRDNTNLTRPLPPVPINSV